MDEPRTTTIGDLLARDGGSIKTGPFGTTLKAAEYSKSGVPIISVGEVGYGRLRVRADTPRAGSDLLARLPDYVLNTGDIVFGRKGAVDRSAYVLPAEAGSFLGSDGIRLRLPQSVDAKFIAYQLQTERLRAWVMQHATGSTMPSLNQGVIERIPIVLPELERQHRIAEILGALDDKIELSRRMGECLEASARAMYRSWRGGQPDRVLRPIGDVCRVQSGGTPSKARPELWSGSIPWISPKVMTAIHCDEPDAYVSKAAIGNGTRLAPAGATLVMVRGMGLHEGVRVSQARVDLTFNQDVKALVPGEAEPALLLFAVLDAQQSLHDKVESSGHGTGVLATEVLSSYTIPMPDPAARRSIAEQLARVNDRIATTRDQARTLADIRDTLLPRLLDGRLTC